MADDTPLNLQLTYKKFFADHPEVAAEVVDPNVSVREHMRPDAPTTYVKKNTHGEVMITQGEFSAFVWARKTGYRPALKSGA